MSNRILTTLAALIVGTLLGIGATTAGFATAPQHNNTHRSTAPAEHEVPPWMNRECRQEDSTNCYWNGGTVKPRQGEAYIRLMPYSGTVCVFFVHRPRQDYCRHILED